MKSIKVNGIEVNGIEISILEIKHNNIDRSDKECYFVKNNDCSYKKNISLKISKNQIISTQIFLNIKNKSNEIWHSRSGDWVLIDSNGFSYRDYGICSDLRPSRKYGIGDWSLSPQTQANYFLIFPELEKGKQISKLIYVVKNISNEFIINEYSEEAKSSFQLKNPIDITNLNPEKSFYDKFGVPRLRTNDGHFVRSAMEVVIDDYLFNEKIAHIYECILPNEQNILCDWFLPEYNTFIEYWGISNNKEYEDRKNIKMAFYDNNNMNLISLFPNDIKNLGDIFTTQLNRIGFIKNNIEEPILNENTEIISSFIAIDFETANNNKTSACSIGVVVVENNNILISKEYLIKPPTDKFEFTSYHGLKYDDVKESPIFSEIWIDLYPLFNIYKNIIAHNMPFDSSILKALIAHYNLKLPELNYYCTLKESRKNIKSENYKLDTICNLLNIDLKHHNALSDANAAAKIFMHINNLKLVS